MEQLKGMKEALMSCAENQIYGNLEKVDAKELGEVIDMIKDLAETEYYCSIVRSMEESEEKERYGSRYAMYSPRYNNQMYHDPYRMPMEPYDPRMRESMYAQGGNGGSSSGGSTSYARNGSGGNNARGGGMRGYSEGWMPYEMPMYMNRDPREGRSGERRKMYMEGKGSKDKSHQMQELETYMQELSSDITEMIQDASPEEKQMLQQKIVTLANKIK
jgi:hypothetical protein